MKKTSLLLLLLWSSVIYADPDQFKITITNNVVENCILKEKTILEGYVSDLTTIPTRIRPDETASFFMRSGTAYPIGNSGYSTIVPSFLKEKIILLTYSCGENQEITLFTDKGFFGVSEKIGGKVLNAQIINAKFTTRFPSWFSKNEKDFPEIHWTLTY